MKIQESGNNYPISLNENIKWFRSNGLRSYLICKNDHTLYNLHYRLAKSISTHLNEQHIDNKLKTSLQYVSNIFNIVGFIIFFSLSCFCNPLNLKL